MRAWRSPQACRVLVMGTGGFSHQLDGMRAGFISQKLDLMGSQQMVDEPEASTRCSIQQLIVQTGTQGVELPSGSPCAAC